jgi:predicted metal-binding membrane protein
MTALGVAIPASGRLRRPILRPEQLALGVLTAAAWVLLAASGHLSPADPHAAVHDDHTGHMGHEMAAGHGHGAALGLIVPAAMTVAMMAPGLGPMARYMRERTLRRRWWATPTVLVTYFAVWLAVGTVVSRLAPGHDVSSAVVVWSLLAASAWQLTPVKRWATRACERPVGLQLRGAGATRSEVVFGLHQGAACVLSCWAVMTPMLIGAEPALLLMVSGTVVVTAERIARRPALARRAGAALLAATAIAVAW